MSLKNRFPAFIFMSILFLLLSPAHALAQDPSIAGISPGSGGVGSSIYIAGSNFGATQGSSTVTFNGVAATATSWSNTALNATVPAGATTGNIVVTVGGVASNGFAFTVTTLTSLSIAPQNPSAIVGNTQQFCATGTYSDNSTQDLTATAIWTSSAPAVATINSSGLASALGLGETTIQASVGGIQASTVLTVPGFTLTGSLNTGRNGQTATLLNNGTVLVVGGYDMNGHALASAELYNPSTGTFAATGSLNIARTNDSATLLDNGSVLIVGGFDSNGNLLSSAETYSPATGVFTLTAGTLAAARANHTATLLGNGTVLIAGSADSSGNVLASAEIYNPTTGTFNPTGNLNSARGLHTATLLNDGTVLISGGGGNSGVLASAELYNPATNSFAATGNLITGRFQHTATLLNNGMVLVAGGTDTSDNVLASAELYNPATMTFTPTGSMNTARGDHAATLLTDGVVLVEGGFTNTADMSASAELYDPVAGTFSQTGSLNVARQVQTATLLQNGYVLVAGGFSDDSFALTSAEIYRPATLVPPNLVSIVVNPLNPSIPAGGAQNFTAIGTFSDSSTESLTSATWSSSNTAIATLSNDSSDRGVASGLTTGTVAVNACAGQVCGSTTLSVVPSPSIATIYPASGPVGSIVTIIGANFGASQSSVTVSFNGIAATVIGWNNTTVTATVPAGATTGNVLLTVSGVPSNGMTFAVIASQFPPSISASVSPAPNANGWNNTSVSISYSCGAGGNVNNGGVPLTQSSCPAAQLVTTQGANQQITGTVTDAGTNTASVTTTVSIDETPPTLTVSSPADGTGFSSPAVTISGSASDSLSGLAPVACNGTSVTVTSGSFSCNISLNAGVNLVVIQATDNAGNVSASLLHLTYVTTLPSPASLQITPANANVLVGATQQFTAVDQLGRPRSDATWTIDNTNIATISTDTSPVLTGVAAGTATLTATIGSVSAQVQVNVLAGSSLPVGTAVWSAPPVSGFTTQQIVQATPTTNGPSLYAIDSDGSANFLVRAFTSDGQQLWQNQLAMAQVGYNLYQTMGDASGGLLLVTDQAMIDIDGQSGMVAWENSNLAADPASIAQDGSILSVDSNGDFAKINPQSGQPVPVYTPPINFYQSTGASACIINTPVISGTSSWTAPGSVGPSVVDAQGNAFFAAAATTQATAPSCVDGEEFGVTLTNTTQYLLVETTPTGTTTFTTLPISMPVPLFDRPTLPIVLAPDGNGGAFVQWATTNSGAVIMDTSIGATYPSPLPNGLATQFVIGQNNNALFTDGSAIGTIVSGEAQLSYQSTGGNLSITAATGDGGLAINDSELGAIQLDSSGTPGTPVAALQGAVPFDLLYWQTTINGVVTFLWSPNGSNGIQNTVADTVSPVPSGDPQHQSEPPICHVLRCALAPVNDVVSGIPPTAERDVTYGVYAQQNGQLMPLYEEPRTPYLITLFEVSISGPAVKCTNGCTNQKESTDLFNDGLFEDDLAAQFGGTSVAKQTYFVQRGQVPIFWPDQTGTNWYGALSQTATASPSDARGATFLQATPLTGPLGCLPGPLGERGCNTMQP